MSKTNYDWLVAEPFALHLSAGYFGFYAHAGLISALHGSGLRPGRIVGVSAGALAGGLWAAGLPADELEEDLRALRREDFWDPGLPVGGLLKGQRLAASLSAMLLETGITQVEETPIEFAAVAFDPIRREPVVLDRGRLVECIRASCAMPIMFQPVRFGGRLLVDGGVGDRPGLVARRQGQRTLLHYLPARSPWSRLYDDEVGRTQGVPDCRTLVVPGLPRVSPFHMERGMWAFYQVRELALRWLQQAPEA